MARRISARRRNEFSDVVSTDVAEQNVLCDQKVRHGEPRKLVYRRLRGIEHHFDGRWPETTKICCWYCRLPFKTTPVPIVQQYDAVRDQYDVYGITCSPACSKAFISRSNNNDSRTRLMWQSKMLIDVFGWPSETPIPIANDWESIDVFGGYLTIDEFRKQSPGVKIRVKKPPFVPYYVFTETEHKKVAVVDESEENFANADPADTLEEQAIMHGAAFSLKNLRRPPEDEVIRTVDHLRTAHPRHKELQSNSVFDEFLKSQPLPTEAECQAIRDQREADRKAKRKRKRTATTATKTAAAARGKTLFVQETQPPDSSPILPDDDGDDGAMKRSKRGVKRVPMDVGAGPVPKSHKRSKVFSDD